jgi:hypothetical protein
MAPVPALSNQFQRATSRALVAAQGRMVAVAKARHAAVMNREPRPSGFLRIVDGRLNALETTVKATGIIIYVYQRTQIGFERDAKQTIARLDEILQFALTTLRSLSPVGSGGDPHPGLYRDSHKLFKNGYPIDVLTSWKEGDEVSITNYVDYSRILEVGDGKLRLPLKVYERAKDIVEEKYGRDARIEFTWRGISASYQIAQQANRRRGFSVKVAAGSRQYNVAKYRFPTLVITPLHAQGQGALDRIGQIAGIASNVLSIAGAVGQIGSALNSASSISGSRPLRIADHGMTIDG